MRRWRFFSALSLGLISLSLSLSAAQLLTPPNSTYNGPGPYCQAANRPQALALGQWVRVYGHRVPAGQLISYADQFDQLTHDLLAYFGPPQRAVFDVCIDADPGLPTLASANPTLGLGTRTGLGLSSLEALSGRHPHFNNSRDFWLNARHEMVHVLTLQKVPNIDLWFAEGLAVYLSGQFASGKFVSSDIDLQGWKKAKRQHPLTCTALPYTEDCGVGGKTYRLWGAAVAFLFGKIEDGGAGNVAESVIPALLDDLSRSRNFEQSFNRQFRYRGQSLTLAQFKQSFYDWTSAYYQHLMVSGTIDKPQKKYTELKVVPSGQPLTSEVARGDIDNDRYSIMLFGIPDGNYDILLGDASNVFDRVNKNVTISNGKITPSTLRGAW